MGKLKVYVHIGNGKTGSTSIQKILEKKKEELLENGVLYVGRFMELAPAKLYDWQDFRKKDIFWKLSDEQRLEQVSNVLRASLEKLNDISCIVWSHESFINRHITMAPLLKSLQEEMQCDVYPVAYVRRHEDWCVSAYFQWGIKHKSVQGYSVPSFQEWVHSKPVYLFSVVLKKWQNDFGDDFVLRNFDAVDNLVNDFFNVIGIEWLENNYLHSYKSPDAEELFFRTVFNFGHKGEVLPGRFDREVECFPFNRQVLKPTEFSDEILPRKSVIEEEKVRFAEDKKNVNALLAEKGEPALTDSESSFNYAIDQEKLLSIAIHMIVNQEKKISFLEKRLSEIESKN
ncbi:MAG: hypothetical protein GYB28_11860 [Gammaproteobacteria bacterium]|nr:hypothetical protein [Gammaproteobacteria bacterium]